MFVFVTPTSLAFISVRAVAAISLAVVLLTLAVVRGESDLEPRDLVVRRAELRLREAGGSSGGLFERGGEGGE